MSDDSTDGDGRGSTTGRRGLLKAAAAAGVTLPALSGLGGAASNAALGADAGAAATDGSNGDGAWCPPCIDRIAGYNALSMDEPLPDELPEPDHTVEMHLDDADVVFPEACDSPDDPPSTIDPTEEGTVEEAAEEAVPDFYFDPVGLRIRPGDVVSFPNVSSDLHTVTSWSSRFGLGQRIPENAPPFGSPVIMPGEEWVYRFPEPGVYDVLCLPHFDLGMVMRVVATPEGGEVPEAPPVDEETTPPVPAAVLKAPELDPQNIVEEGSVAWTDLRDSVPAFDIGELFGE